MQIRKGDKKDLEKIYQLYKKTASSPEGLARTPEEISQELVANFIEKSLENGLIFVVENSEKIIAEIHTYKNEPKCFQPSLSNLIIAIDPDFQGRGLGKKIFSHLLEEIKNNHRKIARVELFARQKNLRAIKLYQSLGFEIEGILKNRILDSAGNLSDDTIMAWHNPNFEAI
jgi:putative acetyltransferase